MAYPNFLAADPPDYVKMFMGIREGLNDIDNKNARTRIEDQQQKTQQWMAQIAQERAKQEALNAGLDNTRADRQLDASIANSQRDDVRAGETLGLQRARDNHAVMMDNLGKEDDKTLGSFAAEIQAMSPEDATGDKAGDALRRYSARMKNPGKLYTLYPAIIKQNPVYDNELERKDAFSKTSQEAQNAYQDSRAQGLDHRAAMNNLRLQHEEDVAKAALEKKGTGQPDTEVKAPDVSQAEKAIEGAIESDPEIKGDQKAVIFGNALREVMRRKAQGQVPSGEDYKNIIYNAKHGITDQHSKDLDALLQK